MHYEKMSDGTVKCIEDEIPFEVPESWVWTRLSSFAVIITKGASPSWQGVKYTSEGVLFITSENVGTEKLLLETPKYLDIKMNAIQPRSILKKHDILTNIVGASIGRTCEFDIDTDNCNINQAVSLVRLVNLATVPFVVKYLNSNFALELMMRGQVNVARANLSLSTLGSFILPIPPLLEQKRILEVTALAFKQISIIESDKSDLLAIISQAKSKILDLAIRGKLVPQDPADEPASLLLERIRAEKEQLITAGKIKREKNESYIFRGDDKSYYQYKGGKRLCVGEMIPFDLPQQWQWCQLGEICDYGNCNNTNTATLPDDAWILDLEDIEKDTGKVLQRITVAKRKSNSTKHAFYNGQLLYSKLRPYLNKVLIADDDGYCTSEILPLEFANIIFPPYARHVLMSTYFLGYANQCSYGVKMPRLGTNDGKRAWIPLPPLSEQHRIAAAVDATFAQLDTNTDALA